MRHRLLGVEHPLVHVDVDEVGAAADLLERHLDRAGRAPVEVLLESAKSIGATLLIMGGYSHSRLREVVFGGFTQRILNGADLPVLMAH